MPCFDVIFNHNFIFLGIWLLIIVVLQHQNDYKNKRKSWYNKMLKGYQ